MESDSGSQKIDERYSRQVLLAEIGLAGQKILSRASAVIIGIGALGGVIANNLTRAGIGRIKLVDRDMVELNNLHRQTLYDEGDVGEPKVMAAVRKLEMVNSKISIEPLLKDANFSNIELIIRGADVVVDGTDNMETRFLMNDTCVKNDIPWVYGGAVGTNGMTMSMIPGKTACFRCLNPHIPPAGALGTCDTMGVVNAITGVIGSIESSEAIKILLGSGDVNANLLIYDVWRHGFQSIQIPRNSDCKCCVRRDFEFLNVTRRTLVTSLCGKETIQITPMEPGKITLRELGGRLENLGKVEYADYAITFKISGYEITIFNDGRATVKGTSDDVLARSLYSKYAGM